MSGASETRKKGGEEILDELRGVLASAGDREFKARRMAEILRAAGPCRWVGIYELRDGEIAAIAWTGPEAPAYPRFPASEGLCGSAVRAGNTVVVGDVTQDPRYLTTFGTTRSEMIVPILRGPERTVLGLIDVESERVNAFRDQDRAFFERCAAILAPLWGAP